MQPLVGITTYSPLEHPAPSTHYSHHYAVPADYVDAVRRAGGTPVLLPPGESNPERWVEGLDALLVTGGTDVSPANYGQDPDREEILLRAADRDESELKLTVLAIEHKLPTLFVCRGMQVLNVALGGTLIPHLPEVLDDDIHRDGNGWWTTHEVAAVAGSRLVKAMGTEAVSTYSGHHQALSEVAQGLSVTAVAPDGIIEAIEADDHPWAVGVQWHPEISAKSDASQQGLFDALVTMGRSD